MYARANKPRTTRNSQKTALTLQTRQVGTGVNKGAPKPVPLSPPLSPQPSPRSEASTSDNEGEWITPTRKPRKALRQQTTPVSPPAFKPSARKSPAKSAPYTPVRKPPPKVAPVLASPESESDDEAESLADLMGPAPKVELRKTKKPAAKLNSVTEKLGVEMTGSYQGGRYPSDTNTHAHLPSDLDYGGYRSRQILHHFSEVLKWHLEENKLAPVEVQAQYLKRGGQFHLAVSANQKQSQDFLQKMSGEELASLYSAAMRKDAPERVQKSAAKLLHIKAQNAQRLEDETEEKPEDKRDLADAEALSALMRDRDKFSVAMNPWGRHAEQNLHKAFTDAFGKEDGDKTDVAGTLIRCGGCSSALSVDKTLSALLTSNGHKVKDVTGKFYPSQADVEDWKPLFKDIVEGNTFVEHGNSKRRSSMSPAAYFAKPESKEGKATKGKVLTFPDSPYVAQKKKAAAKKGDGGPH